MHHRYWQRGSTTTDGTAYGSPGASVGHVWTKRERSARYRAVEHIP